MNINWPIVIKGLLAFLIPYVILELIRREINHKGPKLVYYLSPITTHAVPSVQTPPSAASNPPVPAPQTIWLNSYVLTIRNNGNVAAHDIEISHPQWPHHFEIRPLVRHETVPGPNGQRRWIRIPALAPKETVSISYLFGPVQNWGDLLEYVRSEEGVATKLEMNFTRVFPMWLNWIFLIFSVLGLVFLGVIIWWLYPPLAHFVEILIKYPRA